MLLPDPNSLFIILIIISGIAEFFLPTTQSTGLRFGIVVVALFSTMFSSGALVAGNLTVFSALIMVLAVYRVVNQLRAVEERRTQAGRKHTVRKTLYVLFCAQLAVYIAGIIWKQHGNSNLIQSALVGVAAISVLISLGLLLHAATVLRRGNITGIEPEKQLKKLPTLSVLIPARNETQDLTACLEALLASSYPKMEIIVYDDCSQDDTPGIIRSFAAKGVRFIKGEPLPERWLAKNFAYQQLAKQASGELLLFMGVDVRVQPQSVSLMVAAMREKSLSMLSVLPKRSGQGLLASLVQPMRYWWELAPPRWAIGHPPVLSTLLVFLTY